MTLPQTIAATLSGSEPTAVLHTALPSESELSADELICLAITLRVIASDARQRYFNRAPAARSTYSTNKPKHTERY